MAKHLTICKLSHFGANIYQKKNYFLQIHIKIDLHMAVDWRIKQISQHLQALQLFVY
jgi:hypothetical protein